MLSTRKSMSNFYSSIVKPIRKSEAFDMKHVSSSAAAAASSIVPTQKDIRDKSQPNLDQVRNVVSIVQNYQSVRHYTTLPRTRSLSTSTVSPISAPSNSFSSTSKAPSAPAPLPLFAIQYEFVENMIEKRTPYREKHLKLLEASSGCVFGGKVIRYY